MSLDAVSVARTLLSMSQERVSQDVSMKVIKSEAEAGEAIATLLQTQAEQMKTYNSAGTIVDPYTPSAVDIRM